MLLLATPLLYCSQVFSWMDNPPPCNQSVLLHVITRLAALIARTFSKDWNFLPVETAHKKFIPSLVPLSMRVSRCSQTL